MAENFVHLHVHTQHSLLDSAIKIPKLVQHIKGFGITACAATEHGWMASAIDFYKECKKNDIKPLLGVEAYITEDPDGQVNEDKTRDNMHLILIAKNNEGYRGLLKAVSNAAMKNFYYKPRIYKEHLRALGGNVICTTACLGGLIAKKLDFETDSYGRAVACSDTDGLAVKNIQFLKEVFADDLYLEVQVWDNGEHFQQVYNQWLLNYGRAEKLPFVITADSHYLKEEEYELHELLMAMQLKMTIDEYRENSELTYGPHFYVASPEEMLKRAQSIDCEEAYYNTSKIAEKCDVEIELGKFREPLFKIEEASDYQDFKRWKEENDKDNL